MQILEKEKTDHLWPEITLSSYSEQFLIKKKNQRARFPVIQKLSDSNPKF
ncbi:hypothetical protein LEP1GSC188_0738 [Leptospira weilii serovar Topaz str. LT2116]|uniref:Uncharacterized protein n=2 Tax=Leptospira weilii TaxID=28184 RepID=M3GYD4_9LEPT|nr:hypothetical protein LEP1GSC188_0738 [Leptospira weilii serovar Topaz str. LT2116]EMM73448.1 hypothetical protein LEP1GSC038_2552 [Leptospira weilii str. 2006001855]